MKGKRKTLIYNPQKRKTRDKKIGGGSGGVLGRLVGGVWRIGTCC